VFIVVSVYFVMIQSENFWIHPRISTYICWVYQKVSALAAWSKNCKWYSCLQLGAAVSLFCESV